MCDPQSPSPLSEVLLVDFSTLRPTSPMVHGLVNLEAAPPPSVVVVGNRLEVHHLKAARATVSSTTVTLHDEDGMSLGTWTHDGQRLPDWYQPLEFTFCEEYDYHILHDDAHRIERSLWLAREFYRTLPPLAPPPVGPVARPAPAWQPRDPEAPYSIPALMHQHPPHDLLDEWRRHIIRAYEDPPPAQFTHRSRHPTARDYHRRPRFRGDS